MANNNNTNKTDPIKSQTDSKIKSNKNKTQAANTLSNNIKNTPDSNKLQTESQIDSKTESKNSENKSIEGLSENKESDNDSKESYTTTFPNDTLLDGAYGLCIGAAIGDSIGSYCEFSDWKLDPSSSNIVMEMPGGGTWGNQVISGQVTDDTELAISLSYALCSMNKNIFDVQDIAIEYNKWNNSNPFDRGFCTREVLYYAPDVKNMKLKAISYNYEKAEQYKSDGNLANGALMRCMPLVLYGYNLESYDNLYLLMKSDAELTHSNVYVFLVNTCYAIIVLYLLKCDRNEKDKHIKAYNIMIEWLKKQCKNKQNDIKKRNAAKDILYEWLKHIKRNDTSKLHIATKFKGFVKIAFQRVCYHLWHNNNYFDAIKAVVSEGGDSDTNACIVGGVIGVLNGLNGIPNQYIEKIHKCNPLRNNRDRFQAKWYFKKKMIETLLKKAPTDEDFIKNRVEYSIQ